MAGGSIYMRTNESGLEGSLAQLFQHDLFVDHLALAQFSRAPKPLFKLDLLL
jgi:hypothetical protein